MDTEHTGSDLLRDFLNILFKHKIMLMFLFVLVIAVTGVVTFVPSPVYRASAQVLVKFGRENVYLPTMADTGPIINSNSLEQINSEVEILRSQNLHDYVIDNIGPERFYPEFYAPKPGFVGKLKRQLGISEKISARDKALISFQKSVDIEGIKNSRILEISFKHRDPQITSLAVNTLVEGYMSTRLKVHQDVGSYSFFKAQTDLFKEKIKETEENLKNLKEKYDVISLPDERTLLLQQKTAMVSELNASRSQSEEILRRISELEKQLKKTPKSISQGEEIEGNPLLLNTLEARVVELELKLKGLLAKYTENSRLVIDTKEEIQMLRQKLKEQENKQNVKSRYGVNPTFQRLQEDLFSNQVELTAVKAKININEKQLAEYQEHLEKLNQSENRLNELQNELAVNLKNYQLYQTKFEESRIAAEMDNKKLANVSLIKPARAPVKPVSPNVILFFLIGGALSLTGPVVFVFLLELLNDRIERPEDVEDIMNIPVLASIPVTKKKS